MRLFSLSLTHTLRCARPRRSARTHARSTVVGTIITQQQQSLPHSSPQNDFKTVPTSRVQNRITVCSRRVEKTFSYYTEVHIIVFFPILRPHVRRLCMCVRTRNGMPYTGSLTVRVLFNASAPRQSQCSKKKNSIFSSNFRLQKLFLKTTSNDGGVRKYL